jgi:hypothetical protein
MPKSSEKDSSENIQLEPLSRTPRRHESTDPAEIDAKAPLRHAARKTCDSGMCNILLCLVKFLFHVAKYYIHMNFITQKIIRNVLQLINSDNFNEKTDIKCNMNFINWLHSVLARNNFRQKVMCARLCYTFIS